MTVGKPARKKAGAARRAAALAKPRKADLGFAPLVDRIVAILDDARGRVVRSVNSEMVLAYWHIGRELVEYHQGGAARAEYGDQLLEELSAKLQDRVGRGYSVSNLRYFRLFFQVYADREPRIRHEARDGSRPVGIHHEARDVLAATSKSARSGGPLDGFSSRLSWTHYRTLTKVESTAERSFLEIEAELANWSVPHLERQIHTKLFGRLGKSRDRAGVMELSSRGHVLERPADAIKHPYVLEFLDLPESAQLRESDLEQAILEKLQHFLLELGKGFAFVARQKRLSFHRRTRRNSSSDLVRAPWTVRPRAPSRGPMPPTTPTTTRPRFDTSRGCTANRTPTLARHAR